MSFIDGNYWKERSDLLYYRYVDYILRVIGVNCKALLDVGTGNSPYLEWFDWIENKYSIDLETPYQSNNVTGIKGNIFDTNFDSKFDVVTCLQVLEHVHDAYKFAQRLLQLGTIILVSVPYKWPKGKSPDHIHDPIDHFKIDSWFGRPPIIQLW